MGFHSRVAICGGLVAPLLALCGCGGNAGCNSMIGVAVSPTSATANHLAVSPGNQAQFIATAALKGGPGCVISALAARQFGTWSNPDPAAIQISSANDITNGTAVCKAATNGPVTLSGTFTQNLRSPETITVQLTCR